MSQASSLSSASPAASRGQNPDNQVGLRSTTNAERRRQALAATTSASPSPPAAKRKTPGKTTPKKPTTALTKSHGAAQVEETEVAGVSDSEWKARLETLEKNFNIIREEEEANKAVIQDLRDKLEEEVWAKSRLEEKLKELTERLEKAEEYLAGGGGGGGVTAQSECEKLDRMREERKKEMKEVEERLDGRIRRVEIQNGEETGGGGGRGERNEEANVRKQRCIVLTDSNGRNTTQNTIMNHVPRENRKEIDVEVVVAYTLDEAYRRIDRGEIDVGGAIVLVDDLTNDVRGTRQRPAVTPQQLLRLVDNLRRRVMAAGAQAVIVCQLKPMQTVDVTPFNQQLCDYLRREKKRGRDGFGCRTQIRLDYLKGDGYHVRPDFLSVIDRTYACAFLSAEVPDPTPLDEFAPSFVREQWKADWPRLAGGGAGLTRLS